MTQPLRRTKIVTTLGPSTDKDNVLEEIIRAAYECGQDEFFSRQRRGS